MGGTESVKSYIKQKLGTELFNSLDIESWSYVRATDANGGYEAIVVIFNYQDLVQEVVKMSY